MHKQRSIMTSIVFERKLLKRLYTWFVKVLITTKCRALHDGGTHKKYSHICCVLIFTNSLYWVVNGVCLHGLESRSKRRFKTWFGLFLIWKPDFSPCKQKAVSNQAFGTHFETRQKRAFWIVIRLESLILVHVNAKLFQNVIHACAF